ncbi:MAG: outer-membrane lipoprotein carrier protein LolA [Mariprofundaceae bacterium]|nr:outer-membrane lipoprotein carrier protein LolA [Mariprofundaceae bacterium]
MSLLSIIRAIGVALFCSLTASVAMAQTASGKAVPDQLDMALNRMAETPGITCEFLQIVSFTDGGEQRYSGTLSISRPGRFHWKYLMPYEQLYVSDGNGVWHYEAELMQAERLQSLDAVDPVVMQLLDGRMSRKDIELLGFERLDRDETAYRITVDQKQELVLALTDSGELRWLESEDVLGNRNRIVFIGIEKKRQPDDYFRFVPPDGVDVINVADPLPEATDND